MANFLIEPVVFNHFSGAEPHGNILLARGLLVHNCTGELKITITRNPWTKLVEPWLKSIVFNHSSLSHKWRPNFNTAKRLLTLSR